MKSIILSNGELEIKEIENTLETLQKIVGGYIEIPFLSHTLNQNNIRTIINEEGKLIENMAPEIAVLDKKTNKLLDIVYGNCVFVGDNNDGDFIGLNEEQIKIIMSELKFEVALTYKDDENNERKLLVKALFV